MDDGFDDGTGDLNGSDDTLILEEGVQDEDPL